MRQTAIIIGSCVAVLGGAWWASKALTDVPGPAPGADPVRHVEPAPVAEAPALPPLRKRPDEVPPPQPPAPAEAPHPAVQPLQPPTAAAPAAPVQPLEPEYNPYLDPESPELDYADRLLFEEKFDRQRLESARGVYQRCIEAAPHIQRCRDNLVLVEERLARAPAEKYSPARAKELPFSPPMRPAGILRPNPAMQLQPAPQQP